MCLEGVRVSESKLVRAYGNEVLDIPHFHLTTVLPAFREPRLWLPAVRAWCVTRNIIGKACVGSAVHTLTRGLGWWNATLKKKIILPIGTNNDTWNAYGAKGMNEVPPRQFCQLPLKRYSSIGNTWLRWFNYWKRRQRGAEGQSVCCSQLALALTNTIGSGRRVAEVA